MQKPLLLAASLLAGIGAIQPAQAQIGLINLGVKSALLAHQLSKKNNVAAAPTPTETYQGQSFPMQRTPAEQLPAKGQEQIAALEGQLDRCHATLLADPAAPLFTPDQQQELVSAAVAAARANPSWNQQDYQKEVSFYLAENTRRQQAAAPAPAPVK